jgi:N-methylhydantoinase B
MSSRIDPVTVEVVTNALTALAGEMTINLSRTAFNTIVYEVRDFCTGILDAEARLVTQAPGGLPLFVGDLDAPVRDGLNLYGKDGFAPGDVIITNHTGTCGHHLNNVVVYTPTFYRGELVAFPAVRAHWIDIGGRLPGGFLTDAVTSFEEGIQIRTVKLYRGGEPNEELFRIMRHNIRQPESVFGDLRAQIAACRLGERRLIDLLDKYGRNSVFACIRANWNHAERIVRGEIEKIPDGTYEAESFLDDDGVDLGTPVPVRVKVIVQGSELTVDFSGMSPQVRGPINSGPPVGLSVARLALKYLAAPQVLISEGCFRPLKVILPTGTLISAEEPAAMSWWQTPVLTVIDTILKAVGLATPNRIPAGHYSDIAAILLSGFNPETSRSYSNVEPLAGGWGGRPNGDGMSSTYTIGHGDTYNIPIEVLETRFPVQIEYYRLRTDSGGPGRYRGGLGVERQYRIPYGGRLNALSERSKCPPWGLEGGLNGASGRIEVKQTGRSKIKRYQKVTGLELRPGAYFTFYSGGGGGYGDPLERDPGQVAADVRMGYVSASAAREHYGVVFKPNSFTVNRMATLRLRKKLRRFRQEASGSKKTNEPENPQG